MALSHELCAQLLFAVVVLVLQELECSSDRSVSDSSSEHSTPLLMAGQEKCKLPAAIRELCHLPLAPSWLLSNGASRIQSVLAVNYTLLAVLQVSVLPILPAIQAWHTLYRCSSYLHLGTLQRVK